MIDEMRDWALWYTAIMCMALITSALIYRLVMR